MQKRRHASEDERGQGAEGTGEETEGDNRGMGESRWGSKIVGLRWVEGIMGSSCYLKCVQVYTASSSAELFNTYATTHKCVRAHTHTHRHLYNYFITWSHKCFLISAQGEVVTSPECVNCVESLVVVALVYTLHVDVWEQRASECVCVCVCVCVCLRDNKCYYNRLNTVREVHYITGYSHSAA